MQHSGPSVFCFHLSKGGNSRCQKTLWKTDYFEIRYEDQNKNKKFFYPFAGEGLRYEIKDFVGAILSEEGTWPKISTRENLAMAKVQEDFLAGKNVYKI